MCCCVFQAGGWRVDRVRPALRPPGATGGASSGEAAVRASLKDYSERLPQPFDLVEVEGRVKEKSPYVVVALQEVGRALGGGGPGAVGWEGA